MPCVSRRFFRQAWRHSRGRKNYILSGRSPAIPLNKKTDWFRLGEDRGTALHMFRNNRAMRQVLVEYATDRRLTVHMYSAGGVRLPVQVPLRLRACRNCSSAADSPAATFSSHVSQVPLPCHTSWDGHCTVNS
jgi:hypothetical protein